MTEYYSKYVYSNDTPRYVLFDESILPAYAKILPEWITGRIKNHYYEKWAEEFFYSEKEKMIREFNDYMKEIGAPEGSYEASVSSLYVATDYMPFIEVKAELMATFYDDEIAMEWCNYVGTKNVSLYESNDFGPDIHY